MSHCLTKPTTWSVHPAKTQISPGQRRLSDWASSKDWSDWAFAQADLSSLGVQAVCWFCLAATHMEKQPVWSTRWPMFALVEHYIGTQGENVNSKRSLNPPVVYAAYHSKVVVLVVFLVALLFILWGASCLVFPCSMSSCFFSPFSIVITSLGEEGAGLCASRAFVCLFVLHTLNFVLFLFLLVLGAGCSFWLWHSLDFSINFLGILFLNYHQIPSLYVAHYQR